MARPAARLGTDTVVSAANVGEATAGDVKYLVIAGPSGRRLGVLAAAVTDADPTDPLDVDALFA